MTLFTNPLKSVSLNVSDTFSAPAPFLLQDMHVQKSKILEQCKFSKNTYLLQLSCTD